MAFPANAPLLLEPSLVELDEPHVVARREELSNRGMVGVVDIHLRSPGDLITLGFGAQCVILVLEHADFIALIERTKTLVGITPKCHAKHHRHADWVPLRLVSLT